MLSIGYLLCGSVWSTSGNIACEFSNFTLVGYKKSEEDWKKVKKKKTIYSSIVDNNPFDYTIFNLFAQPNSSYFINGLPVQPIKTKQKTSYYVVVH